MLRLKFVFAKIQLKMSADEIYKMRKKLLQFQKLYKEDWESDKHMIYYPVHITPGYEQALDASKFQSNVRTLYSLFYHFFTLIRNNLTVLISMRFKFYAYYRILLSFFCS